MDANWRRDIWLALEDFRTVSDLAGSKIVFEKEDVEFLHKPRLPTGKMAIYGFWFDGAWLKIGQAGPNSGPRYTYQHYGFKVGSTLAKSLSSDESMRKIAGLEKDDESGWGGVDRT